MRAGNAFRRTFLDEVAERDQPRSAAEADYDGLWAMLPCPPSSSPPGDAQ